MQGMYDRFQKSMQENEGSFCNEIAQKLKSEGDIESFTTMMMYRAFCFGYELAQRDVNSTVSISG